jgi:hypothetical protein
VNALVRWWGRLTGRKPATATAAPSPAKPQVKTATAGPGELELAERPPPKKPSRLGAAGFDPYASDGGYAKPGTWDRVNHD